MIADCTAIILAGGQSSRMGQDKASLRFGEQTLLQNVLSILQPCFAETFVSVRELRSEISQRQIFDDLKYRGPLAGLLVALEAAPTPWIFLVACDMPFITIEMVEYLAAQRQHHHQAVVPRVQEHPQPMAAFYNKNASEQIRAVLQDPTAKHSLRSVLEKLDTLYVEADSLREVDPQLRSFFDLDTPSDLVQASLLR
ncbi:MAG: molybdenum cofactor guanylyltransferase [Gallionellaceae bacterium]